jgi:acyl-CoA synthetase (AMP-forming)/AMP-acid ligase II
MTVILPPPIVFQGQRWSTEALTGMAVGLRRALGGERRRSTRRLAMVMANRPESIALFFALSSFSVPLVLLPPDMKPWQSDPPLPRDTLLVLLESERDLEASARALDVPIAVIAEPEPPGGSPDAPAFMTMPGVVLFTSGSTGRPRPVYRSTRGLVDVSRALLHAFGLRPGDGVITTLPLARAFGLNHGLMAAAALGSPLALFDHFEHNGLLRLFGSGGYRYWAGTPMMADVLGRTRLSGTHPAPPVCVIGGRVSSEIARRFLERFGVPLRQCYGTTETGSIAVDGAPSEHVRSDTAGRPLAGVDVRIGDDPRVPLHAGHAGRIWLSTPAYMMDGYGFPPDLHPPETVAGWWGTPDVGAMDDRGALVVSGRLDDCFRTNAGHLVDPASVAAALDGYPSVIDTAVVPLATLTGPALGVLIESTAPLRMTDVRGHLARSLPVWSRPRVIETISALPRLSNGRIDRRACIAVLEKALSSDGSA